ncbi:hypothetical protein F5Y16DRAFT_224294 [Xylariaceae sp. FL0255]|nr:hypothetical protein F5Y16DRAFT_224294 [Xylariaceae sp. FL0255]
MCDNCSNCNCGSGGKEYKPYTTPYTGAGAVHTPTGWVNSRDFGAPGAQSGPGPASRRDSNSAAPPPFHHAEVTSTSTSVHSPEGHETPMITTRRRSSPRNINLHGGSEEIAEIKGPGGVGFDLPKDHEDLSLITNREIAHKIGLLNFKKGSIHDAMVETAHSPKILSCSLEQQSNLRDENDKLFTQVNEAIRAWESVQTARVDSLPKPSIVDMLMNSRDHGQDYESDEDDDQNPSDDPQLSSSAASGLIEEKK